MIYIVMYLVIAVIFGKLAWKFNNKLPHFYTSSTKEQAMVMGYLWPVFSWVVVLCGIHTLIMKGVNKWF